MSSTHRASKLFVQIVKCHVVMLLMYEGKGRETDTSTEQGSEDRKINYKSGIVPPNAIKSSNTSILMVFNITQKQKNHNHLQSFARC